MHVETDLDSQVATPTISVETAHDVFSESYSEMATRYTGRDSRKNSLDLGCIQEKCSRLETE